MKNQDKISKIKNNPLSSTHSINDFLENTKIRNRDFENPFLYIKIL